MGNLYLEQGENKVLSIPLVWNGEPYVLPEGGHLVFTMKADLNLPDDSALVVQKLLDYGIVVVDSTASVELLSIDTQRFPSRSYFYTIRAFDEWLENVVVARGLISLQLAVQQELQPQRLVQATWSVGTTAGTIAAGNDSRFTLAESAVQPEDLAQYAPPLSDDDNYVTDAEKAKLAALSGTNTGDQDLSGYSSASHTHAWDSLTGTANHIPLDLTPTAVPTTQGTIFWDTDEETAAVAVEGGSIALGKEDFDYYTNLSGRTLVDGDIVSIIGVSGNRSAVVLTDPTDSTSAMACAGMVTHGGAVNAKVRVTRRGTVHNLNTIGYAEGAQIYASVTTAGAWQSTKPTVAYAVAIGTVRVSSATVGCVDVVVNVRNSKTSDVVGLADDIQEFAIDINRQGFVGITSTSIGFAGTTFTLTDTGSGWSYYRHGIKHTITGNKTVALSAATAGEYYIYIDATDGTLTCGAVNVAWDLDDGKVPVATVAYNSTATPTFWLADERHTVSLDLAMQDYLHSIDGAKMQTVPTLAGYTVNTDTDVAKTFSISACVLRDQDRKHQIALLAEPNGTATDYVTWYRTGASAWTWRAAAMPFVYNSSTNWIQWDNAGTLTDATGGAGGSTRWLNSYLLVTNKSGAARHIIVPGRAIFTSLATAQAEDVAGFTWDGFEIDEAVICYRLTWSTVTSISKGKCRLAATPQAINISTVTNASSGAGTDHNTLSNLQGGSLTERYHLTAAEAALVPTALQPSIILNVNNGGSGISATLTSTAYGNLVYTDGTVTKLYLPVGVEADVGRWVDVRPVTLLTCYKGTVEDDEVVAIVSPYFFMRFYAQEWDGSRLIWDFDNTVKASMERYALHSGIISGDDEFGFIDYDSTNRDYKRTKIQKVWDFMKTIIDAGATWAGNHIFSGNVSVSGLTTVTGAKETVVAIGTVTSTHTLVISTGTLQTATLTASTACTFTMPTATAGTSFTLLLKQAASTGNGTATFTGVKWKDGTAPTITATAGKMDLLVFVSDGTNWYGVATQNFTP